MFLGGILLNKNVQICIFLWHFCIFLTLLAASEPI